METKNLETATIDTYTGYRHNRYDGYQSSWGILMALGASPTANCFADENDSPDEEFDKNYEGAIKIDADFYKTVLNNLDEIPEFDDIEIGETLTETQYWGSFPMKFVFKKMADGSIIVTCNNEIEFLVKI